MRILIIGDVVGRPGRRILRDELPAIREAHGIDVVIANGENAAGGAGITAKTAGEIFSAGVDVITSGNHIWDQREAIQYIEQQPRLLRPINYPGGTPGRGHYLIEREGSCPLAVVNVHGRVFIDTGFSCPFRAMEQMLARLGEAAIVVDFHAEATSEKGAFARHFDGRVDAVIGTHTHVQTADAQLLPGGTAYVTDVGMTGSSEGILGVRSEPVIRRFLTQMPVRFEVAGGDRMINAALLDLTLEDARPRVRGISLVNEAYHDGRRGNG
ncbi:MAG: TIGR00282 family metallophosphoesterase [Bacillota bacterium]